MSSISRTPSIYQIRHIASGKVYVGSAANPRKRWSEHRFELQRGTHHASYLQRTWTKYGKEAFVFEILEPVLFVEDLLTREQYWIDTLRAADRQYGYNASPTAGSPLGTKHSAETRAKASARNNARFADPSARAKASAQTKARYDDPAERAKTAAQSKASWADPDARAKAAERQKVRMADPAYRANVAEQVRARTSDPAERAKRSERQKARWADPTFRQRMTEHMRARWTDPEYRKRMTDLSRLQGKKKEQE